MITEATPTIDTNAYTADDQVGGIQTLTVDPGTKHLKSVTIIDKASQKAEIEVLFFKELPTVASANNAACNVADSELASKCIGVVTVPAASYTDLSAAAVASVECDLEIQTKDGKLYALAKTTGTPTYAANGDLVFKYGIR